MIELFVWKAMFFIKTEFCTWSDYNDIFQTGIRGMKVNVRMVLCGWNIVQAKDP